MAINWGDKPTSTTGISMGQYPEWMKEDMLGAQAAYKKLYEHNLGAGDRPYTGMTTAGFTPEQIASQQGLASLVGSQAPLQQEALGLTRGLTSEFTPEQAQKYMSPYLRASLDAQKAAAQRQFEGTKLPQFEAEAVKAGAMSGLGSRAGVQAAELQSGQNRLMADIEAVGQQKAYEDAQNLFKAQKEREKQTAIALQNLGKGIFTGDIKEQALLDAIGGEKQAMVQSTLDEAQTKYWDKEEFARNELNKWYQSLLGNPIWKQPNVQTTGTQAGGGPGMGKTLMSLAGTAAGLFGGGFKLPFKGGGSIGGGLASTSQARPYMNYMRRNMGGQVVPPVVYRKEPGQVGVVTPRSFAPTLDALRKREIATGRPTAAEITAKNEKLLEEQDAKRFEKEYRIASPSKRLQMDRIKNLKNQAVPLSNPELTSAPVEHAALGPDADTGASSREELAEMGARRQADRAKNEALLAGANRGGPESVATLRNAYNKYKAEVQDFVEADPYRAQKFWFTVAAAISKPGGNAFTNMAQGFKEAVDGLDASAEEKNKFRIALAGKELTTETAVAGIEEKRYLNKRDMISKLLVARATARGSALKEINKQIASMASKAYVNIMKMKDKDLKKMLKGTVKGMSLSKSKLDKLNDLKPEALKSQLLQSLERPGTTRSRAINVLLNAL